MAKELDMVGKKLSNERFIANAKPEVVQKNATNKATTKKEAGVFGRGGGGRNGGMPCFFGIMKSISIDGESYV